MKKILICFGMAFIIPLSHLLAEPSAVDPTETKQSGSVYSFNAAVTQSNLIFSGKIAN